MRFALSFFAFALVCVSIAQYPGVAKPPDDLKRGFETITVKDAKRVLNFLATKCEGRGTGQPGYEKAAQYIAAQFKSIGLKPLGDDGGFLQKTDFTRWRFDPDSLKLHLEGSNLTIGGNEIVLRGSASEINVTSHLVIAKAPLNATDPSGQKFNGDFVIVQAEKRSPQLESAFIDAGAGGVLTVVKTGGPGSWRARMGKITPNVRKTLTGTITEVAFDKLQKSIAAIPKVDSKTSSGIEVASYSVNVSLVGKLVVETIKVGNVVGEIPGSDPKLAGETVGIGGHLDHLGITDGVVYPGADDDGSGSTAVVEIARAVMANPKKPRRTLVFMTFFGEEMGLLGSKFLTDHPPVPLSSMVAELQMDMVGRDSDGTQNGDPSRVDVAADNTNTIRLVGSKRISTDLDTTIQRENQFIGFKFKYDAEDVYTRSDHYNFASKGVPIAFLFDGFHPDYHRPTDTIEKIDWLKLTNAAKLYYLTALEFANADNPPGKNVFRTED